MKTEFGTTVCPGCGAEEIENAFRRIFSHQFACGSDVILQTQELRRTDGCIIAGLRKQLAEAERENGRLTAEDEWNTDNIVGIEKQLANALGRAIEAEKRLAAYGLSKGTPDAKVP